MVSRLEALADAISRYSGYDNPESAAFQNRNPGNLPAISPRHIRDLQGKRVFQSFLDGYQALLFDLKVKASGKSSTRLKPSSTIRDLMASYGQPETAAKYIAKFLKRALSIDSITEQTTLSFFLEEV